MNIYRIGIREIGTTGTRWHYVVQPDVADAAAAARAAHDGPAAVVATGRVSLDRIVAAADEPSTRDEYALQFIADALTAGLEPAELTSEALAGPGRLEGNSDRALAASLEYLWGIGGADESAGDVDVSEHGARFGRYVLVTDSRGFATVETYKTEADASNALEALEPGIGPEGYYQP